MRTLVLTGIKKMEIEDNKLEDPQRGWVTLKVNYAGIRGSELSAFVGQNELRKSLSVMGHEFTGKVVKLGEDVDPKLLNKNVAVNPLVTCGKCRYCKTGNRQLCLERKLIGVDYPGAFAEYVNVPEYSCYEIKEIPEASLAEPLATALRGVLQAGPEIDDRALVIGAGTIGLLATKIFSSVGCRKVVSMDINDNRLEHVDILINNAGICPFEDFFKIDIDLFEKVWKVNVESHYFITQAVSKHMIEKGIKGRILIMSSISGRVGGEFQTHYTTTKSALNGFMHSVAIVLGRYGILVNSLEPGTITTDINKDDLSNEEKRKYMERRTVVGRLGDPEDMVAPALFLVSDDNTYVTGSELLADGGMFINLQ
ncbi:alcohol dehydrogenase [ADH] [Thermoplasma volcanium GSS1]|uniref:Alcohol dehydrogenase [ADH] n=1 Tax=Thermoplasma volcanium (strain ATCC 51530 / DSM 4299 / JCM 9571 / NBRC 15438 / GSS1) TaxID=273116 RepID=Q97BK9_THEVO|nr:SDR family oxidoreductase [Thermoplasma volcanium]BAB59588.1 alcohol dehydrogenase [ADH] [Thermoplasma volcanium GSS1]